MAKHADRPMVAPVVRNASVSRLASAPLRVHAGGGLTAVDARVVSVLEIVARELEKPQLVKYLAARLRLSPSRFEHLFKEETGQGFKTFLRAARLTRAKDLLQDPTLRIKEVAGAVLWPQALVMLVGAVLGGYGGAHFAQKLDPQIVRRFVIAVGISMSVYFFLRH